MEKRESCRRPALAIIVFGLLTSMLGEASAQSASNVPQIFAPGVISGPASERAPAFSPDGNTVYFMRGNAAQSAIMLSQRIGKGWSEPRIAPFSGIWRDIEPALSPDGATLIFASNRPVHDGDKVLDGAWAGKPYPGRGGNLWLVKRQGNGWGKPVRLPDTINATTATFAPAIAGDGSVYFMRADSMSGYFHLYRSQFRDGTYGEATPLPFSDDKIDGMDSAVAPDESFLVFLSTREHKSGDLFIVFKDNDGWGKPINLGESVNGKDGANNVNEARLGADHRTLYFASTYVMPVAFPRTQGQATQQITRLLSWDNGNQNIWSVSLAPRLDAHEGALK